MIYPLMQAFGIELEYMVVHEKDLNTLSLVDKYFTDKNKTPTNEIKRPKISWSNELVTHVIELKNPVPVKSLQDMDIDFQNEIQIINKDLKKYEAMLLPTAMHPWMNPDKETRLWPHENNEIYNAYDRIFSCKGHGWSNLQSMHINLAFANDTEFEKLHAAVRLILALIPALSSSSPLVETKKTGSLSSRLEFYLQNQRRIGSIIGKAIPERVWSRKDYEQMVLQPMYKDISEFDKEAVLQEEWLNSRGAIPKFERDSIEIRLADTNENPFIDISIAIFWVKVLQKLIDQSFLSLEKQKEFAEQDLRLILNETVKNSSDALIEDLEYLKIWGAEKQCKAKNLIALIFDQLDYSDEEKKYKKPIEFILSYGSLSQRILDACSNDFRQENLRPIYKELADCLSETKYFKV